MPPVDTEHPEKSEVIPSTMACERCGLCCQKGGATLHQCDLALVREGSLAWADLVTLRKGEPVYDPILERLICNPSEKIKIKGRDGSWACRYLASDNTTCRHYDHRPSQCRWLFCRDHQPFLTGFRAPFLDRATLFESDANLWPLIQAYDQACSFERFVWPLLKEHLTRMQVGRSQKQRLAYLVDFDRQYRVLAVEKGALQAGCTDLFFGQPLATVVPRILKDARCRQLA